MIVRSWALGLSFFGGKDMKPNQNTCVDVPGFGSRTGDKKLGPRVCLFFLFNVKLTWGEASDTHDIGPVPRRSLI